MESDRGKLFIGGISWDTDEDRLRYYFGAYVEVVEVGIMRDRTTGRARGFGFVVFADHVVAERVLMEKHMIDGRPVEAKKAVPRDDHHITDRNSNKNQGSPEVKQAVPKELSPGPTRSPLVGYNSGFSKTNNFLNSYAQGYNLSPFVSYEVRMDGRLNPIVSGCSGFSPYVSLPYEVNMSLEPGSRSSSFGNKLGYERAPSLNNGRNLNRSQSFLNSPTRNVWETVSLNSSADVASAGSYLGSGNGSLGVYGNSFANFGSSPVSAQIVGSASRSSSGYIEYGIKENNYQLGATGLGRNFGPGRAASSSFVASTGDYERSHEDLYSTNSRFADAPWQSTSSEVDGSSSFGYGLGTAAESTVNSSDGFLGSYSTTNRQASRGIAA
ncbi:Heterogeneous nuclear ribonucleoprotein 1 [Heracleum sosnowskyi]|uniref:Heterogeneous nuclear ribonucleoprotein 1 n=1 Tax=Heracleum sosnowskyi TaxID=360622 RepID=A0AAD8NCP7_9APIA|nr:Heterogeneous nuclear ribonucleoprotein 1 [Heracleum sosnowskyi]